jgi:hypothetical protein
MDTDSHGETTGCILHQIPTNKGFSFQEMSSLNSNTNNSSSISEYLTSQNGDGSVTTVTILSNTC